MPIAIALCVLSLLIFYLNGQETEKLTTQTNTFGPGSSENLDSPTALPLVTRTDLDAQLVISVDLLSEMTALINKKLYENGGHERSLAYLDKLTSEFVASKERAPFETPLVSLTASSTIELPAREILWTLSKIEMTSVADILRLHGDWLQTPFTDISHQAVAGIRDDMQIRPINMPPEAIAMGLTGMPWNDIILDHPELNNTLGQIRTQILIKHAALNKEVWLTQNAIFQASRELDIELDTQTPQLRQLSAYYLPLENVLSEMDSLQVEYRNRVSAELIAAGLAIEHL